MSWQVAEIHTATVVIDGSTLTLKNNVRIVGDNQFSFVFPGWKQNNEIIFTSDVSKYINPFKYTSGTTKPLFRSPVTQDFGSPAWTLNTFPYAILDADEHYAVFTAINNGRDELQLVNLAGNAQPQRIDSPYVVIENIQSLSKQNNTVVFTAARVNEGTRIVKCTISMTGGGLVQADFEVLPVKSQPVMPFTDDIISTPESDVVSGPTGDIQIVFYKPKNPYYSGSSIPGERPPCVVGVHGGPTGLQKQGLDWYRQYFTSRGWAWYVLLSLSRVRLIADWRRRRRRGTGWT
jgi:hypothetical protein